MTFHIEVARCLLIISFPFFLNTGNVICHSARVKAEPLYSQGVCLLKNLYHTTAPCKRKDGNYTCSKTIVDKDSFCKGFSFGAQDCDE